MIRTIASACALGILSTVALAQTPPPPPTGPTKADCDKGYTAGSKWTQAEFSAACEKLKSKN